MICSGVKSEAAVRASSNAFKAISNLILGYKASALVINRDEILNKKILNVPQEKNESRQLTFTINRNYHMSKKIKAILRENQDDINTLLGESTRLIVAERRNQNTASILFAKSGFSKVDLPMNESQKCGAGEDV